MSTLQDKQYLAKQQTSKVLSTKTQEYSPPWRITTPFIPLLIFSFSERKVSLQEEKIQGFVAPDRSKMISLQDPAGMRHKAAYNVPAIKESICFFFPSASCLALSPTVG